MKKITTWLIVGLVASVAVNAAAVGTLVFFHFAGPPVLARPPFCDARPAMVARMDSLRQKMMEARDGLFSVLREPEPSIDKAEPWLRKMAGAQDRLNRAAFEFALKAIMDVPADRRERLLHQFDRHMGPSRGRGRFGPGRHGRRPGHRPAPELESSPEDRLHKGE
jgi:hypothetical protein